VEPGVFFTGAGRPGGRPADAVHDMVMGRLWKMVLGITSEALVTEAHDSLEVVVEFSDGNIADEVMAILPSPGPCLGSSLAV